MDDQAAKPQSAGWLTLDEAGLLLELAGRGSAAGWVEKLVAAAQVGKLPMHEPGGYGRIQCTEQSGPSVVQIGRRKYLLDGGEGSRPVRPFYELAHVDDLNR